MRAWVIDGYSGLEGLHVAEVPDPPPVEGEVLLRVGYAALNPADRYLSEGQYPAKPVWPHILGRDAIGTVEVVGAGVKGLKPGDRRMVLRGPAGVTRPGTFAELVALPAEYLVEIPSGWTDEQAAGATLVYMTAWQALTMWGDLAPSIVLVTGASGGVGIASIQLAHALGHRVVALSRGLAKQKALQAAGADFVVDATGRDWAGMVKGMLAPDRVSLAVDNIGGEPFNGILGVLGDNGCISCVGRLAGPVPSFNTASLFFRRLRVGGVAISSYTSEEAADAWNSAVSLLDKTGARPLVDSVFAFGELPKAFDRLAAGPVGKVLLKVQGLPK